MIAITAIIALLPLLAAAAPLEQRATGIRINFNGDESRCLTVFDSTVVDGSLVSTAPCGRTGSQRWDISLGANPSVKLTGTNFCLDAGTNPNANFQQLKVWTCYPGLTQQGWYLTGDDHIAITGGTTCLDLNNGGGAVQTYQCGGVNQRWITGLNGNTATVAPPVSASATPSAVSSSVMPSGTPAPATGYLIKATAYDNACVTVQGGVPSNFARVALSACSTGGSLSGFEGNQRWEITGGSTKVRLAGTNFCLDASSSPANGVGSYIYQCFDGLPAQQWYLTGDQHLALQGSFVCLDVKAESGPQNTKPYGSLKDLQTWQCSGPDQNQLFQLA